MGGRLSEMLGSSLEEITRSPKDWVAFVVVSFNKISIEIAPGRLSAF